MKITLNIKDSKAASFLSFIKTLDFVSIDIDNNSNEDIELRDEVKAVLDERRTNHLSGKSKSFTWDEVKNDILNS